MRTGCKIQREGKTSKERESSRLDGFDQFASPLDVSSASLNLPFPSPPPPSLLPPRQQSHVSAELAAARTQAFVDELRSMPVAVQTAAANEQHYEVPTPYFLAVLGPKLKYSSCVYPNAKSTLEEAEVAMLELACERAELRDGQDVLELG